MIQVMFETFETQSVFVTMSCILSLFSSFRTHGVVIELGEGLTSIIPCFDGFALPYGMMHLNIAGRDMTKYMMQLLTERGYSFTTSAQKEAARKLKEKVCFASMDYEGDVA